VQITCPSCDATYEVPGPLAAGRIVQCARCSTRWTPVPAAVAPLPAPPPVVAPVAAPVIKPTLSELPPIQPRPGASLPREPPPVFRPASRAPAFRAPASRARVAVTAWVLSLALLGAAAAAVVYREPIMQAWPPSQRAYAAIGLT